MLLWKVNQEGLNFVIKQSLHSLVLVQNNKRIENPVKKSKWYQQKLLDCTTPTYVNPNERLGFLEIGIWWSKKTPVLLISDHTCPTKIQRLWGGEFTALHTLASLGHDETFQFMAEKVDNVNPGTMGNMVYQTILHHYSLQIEEKTFWNYSR